jgi:hypothetical protein
LPNTPKQQYKSPNVSTYQQQQVQVVAEPPEVMFTPGDPIIVDTSIGMWPGIVRFYLFFLFFLDFC